MDLSFQEKSVGASLIALLGVYGYYFYGVVNGAGPASPGGMLGNMIALVIALVVIEIVFHAVIAVFTPEEAADERDVHVRLKAYRLSYLLLVAGVIIVLGRILFGSVFDDQPITLLDTAHQLLFVLVLAETTQFGAQLFYYRRGLA